MRLLPRWPRLPCWRIHCLSLGVSVRKIQVLSPAVSAKYSLSEIQNLLLLPDLFKKSEAIEKDVNQHFAHLHGVLQNIESRLIYNLQEQCGNVTKHLNDIQGRLNIQESQLQSALLMAANTKDIVSRMNLRDIIPKLEKLADAPCHFARNEFFDTQNIVLQTDGSITAILENHCKIDIPEVAICNLLREETLPKSFDLEPFSAETSISNDFMDDSLLSESSIMKRASSCQSLASHESDNRPLREGGISLVKICHIEHPSNFYVRRVSYEQKSAELNEMLHNYASQTDSIPDDVKQNTLYAVKHELSDKWYRGRINSVNTNDDESDTYEVFDVDSGSTEHQVPKERLRNITKPLAMPAPMVLNCALFDIVPKNGKWTSEACQALAKYQEPSESVVMHVVKIQGHTLCVDLSKGHLRNNCPSIRDHLIYSDCGAFNTAHQLLRMTPRAVRRFYREDMALNSYHNVKVTHVESPECIYVQKVEDHSNYLDNMSAEMNAYYIETIKSDDGIIHVPEIGIACAAEEAEGVWRRAIITETTGSRKVTVILVDFGPTITVDYEKIRKLPENFMTASTQAIKVSLSDIKPINEQWTGDAEALISQHFQLAFGQLFAFERHDDVYTVVLYTSTEINVAALLVAKSLAISTGPRSAGRTEAPISPPKTHNSTNKVRNTRTAKKNARKRRARDSKNSSPEETNDPFKLRVKIIRVVSPDTIYVADPSNDASYDSMTAEMQRFYKKNAHIPTNSEWKINNQCAVYSARDGLFCRGKIVGFKNPEIAEVFLYDLSFTEIIPIAELQALKKKFWATRTYAFSVKLAGIYPCGGSLEWLETSCLKLKEIIAKNEGAKFYISKVDSIETNDLDVELWVERVKIDGPLAPARIEINSINRELVETGLALPMKLYNEKKTNILAAELKRYISCVDDDKKAEEIQTNELFQEKEESIDRDSTSEMSSAEDTMISILSISSNHEDNVTVLPSVVTLISNGDSSADQALIPTTEKPTAWLSAEPITDDVFTAMPTSLDNDGCLYLHSIRQSAQTLRYIEKTLAEKYDKTEAQERNRVWEKGEICIAQYHANSKWYRAQVHRMLDNNMIEVEFIDYGNIEECEDYKVRKDVALVNIPRQGTKCVIYGLFPNTETGKWNISDLDRIHALLIERECEISVLGRQPDHLEVSVILTNQKRCDLITYLRRDLHMNVRTARAISESSSDKSTTTMNGDEDVIIDGYIKDDELLQEAGNNDIVGSGDTEHNAEDTDEEQKIIEKKNEACYEGGDFEESEKDSNHNDNSDNEEHEEHDYLEIEYIAMDSSVRAEMPTLTSIPKSKSIILANEEDPDNQDSETFADNENSTYVNNDPIIAGTANFTCSADEIEIHQRVAMGELDCISLPDTLSLIDGEILTSTPHNVTFDVHSLHWRLVEIPEEVQVVKAEVGKIGLLNLCMHLLDNKSSKILMDQRKQYDRIMLEMQAHANDQPLWEMTDKDSPCCAKFTDGVWYRCQVLDYALEPCQSGYTIQVRFVDYGNEAYVGSDEVRILKDEWFEAPCMSMYCNLWNVTLAPVDDFEIACAKIRSVYANKSDMENQSSLAFYVKIEGRLNQTYDVEIYRDEECTELVYQSIIDEGLYVKATNL